MLDITTQMAVFLSVTFSCFLCAAVLEITLHSQLSLSEAARTHKRLGAHKQRQLCSVALISSAQSEGSTVDILAMDLVLVFGTLDRQDSSSIETCHVFLLLSFFMLEDVVTLFVCWVELFQPIKLQNGHADSKMAPEPESAK